MRKLLSYILTLILTLTLTTTFADGFKVGDEDIYHGILNYNNMRKNMVYKDISESFAKTSIIKLTALNIFEREGQNFRPKSNITRREALNYINRALGLEEEIIETEEINRNATREEIATWLAKGLKLQGKTPNIARGFRDYTNFDNETLPLVESFLQEGYIKGYQDGYFRPKRAITKEQLAKVLDNALDDLLLSRGFKIKEGVITNIKTVTTTEEHTPVVQKIYYLNNEDGTYPIIYTSKSNKEHLTKGFLLYKKGKLTTSDELKVNDMIKYYIDHENKVIFAEPLQL